jgi:hypothetical protein
MPRRDRRVSSLLAGAARRGALSTVSSSRSLLAIEVR